MGTIEPWQINKTTLTKRENMKFNPKTHHRRSIRLKGYDYSRAGAYFVTICTQDKRCLFGDIVDRKMVLNDAGRIVQTIWCKLPVRFPKMELDNFVIMPNHFHGIAILLSHRRGESCIRPESCVHDTNKLIDNKKDDHKKGDHKDRPYESAARKKRDNKGRPCGTAPETLGRIVQAFKSITTHEYINGVKQNNWQPFPRKLWQRNYYEHIIRDEDDLNKIREYIIKNPAKWEFDRENPNFVDPRA